jgi:DNA adenine methylase
MNSFKVDPNYTKSKDYCKSPLRYPGGKFYALKFILPILNAVPHQHFYEPFVGGGSVFFGKEKSQLNSINDLDDDIINLYNIIQCPKAFKIFHTLFDEEIASPERHTEVKQFNPNNEIEWAFKTYYLNRTSYSGIIKKPAWGYAVGASSPPENWKVFIQSAHKKLQNVQITQDHFRDCLINIKTKNTLSYIDPPYYKADQKRAYQKSFVLDDHLELADILKRSQFKFVLSYDNCEEIKELYDWAYISKREWFYNTANSAGPRKVGKELIISNFKYDLIEQMSFSSI